jgi:thiol-disulfide isomerase/thioredoxin
MNIKKNIIIFLLIGLLTLLLIIKLVRKTPKKNIFQRVNDVNDLKQCNNNEIPKLINYNASWCKHSKKLEPIWFELEEKLKDKNIKIIKVDCEAKHNKGICYKEKIRYYPTIKLYIKNKVYEYSNSDPNINSLIEFIKERINQV